jgi:uncharacterized protein (DUF433 family)
MPNKLINIDPEIMNGTPVFNGTRIPVYSLFDWLKTETLDEFLENFPSVTRKQAVDVLKLAEKFLTNEQFLNEATSG